MADVDLGTAKGKIEVDASQVGKASKEAGDALDRNLGGAADRSRQSLGLLSGAAVATGAAVVAGFGLAINTAADFEERLSAIKAVSNASEKQMDSLRKKALQLGADTKYSASQSASAMEELVKAGLSVEDVLNGAADATVNLAAAGEVDLVTAATIASNAMNQFGLDAQQMPHVADLIAGAANASAIDVNEFGLALSQAGAVANLVGLSFDDLSVAIAAMGNAGIKGSDAGTSLKTFLNNLQPTTEKQIDLFYDLGLAVEANSTSMNEMGNSFFDANGNIKSMNEIAGILSKSLEGMSEAQKTATLEALFGSDAIRAAAIIAGEGAQGFDELAASMGEVTAADVAATRMDNLKGSIEQLKGSWETLLINVGTPFLGVIRSLVDYLTQAVNWFNQLDERTQTIAASAVLATGALAGLLGTIGLFAAASGPAVAGIGQFGSGIASLVGSLFSMLGVWALVVIAIAALVAGFVYLYKSNEDFREGVDKAVDTVEEFGKKLWHWFMEVGLPAIRAFADYFMANVWPEIKRFAEMAIEAIRRFAVFFVEEVLPRIQDFVGKVVDVISTIVDWITGTAVPAITKAWDAVVEKAVAAWNWFNDNVVSTVVAAVELVVATLQIVVDFITNVVAPYIISAWNTIWPIVQFVFDLIVTIIQTAITTITNVIQFGLDFIQTAWSLFGDNIIAAVVLAFEIIKTTIETVLGIIRGIFQIITGLITGDWDKFLEGIRTIWDTIWNYIASAIGIVLGTIQLAISTFIDFVRLVWETGLNAIRLTAETIWNAIKSFIDITINAIKTIIETAINAIKAIIETVLNTIKFIWEGAWNTMSGFLSGIWEDIKGIIKGAIDAVWSSITDTLSTIRAAWDNAWETIKSTLKNIWDTMVQTVEDKIGDVLQFFQDLPGNIKDALTALKDTIVDIGKKIIDWVVEGIKAAPKAIMDALLALVPSAGDIASAIGGKIGGALDAVTPWATGGIVFGPTFSLIGEAGPEAVIPLTDRNRASALLAASGLDRLALANAGVDRVDSASMPTTNVTVTAPATGPSEVIHIDEYHTHDAADADMLLTQAEFAYSAGRF